MGSVLRAHNFNRSTELAARLEVADGLWARFMGLMGRPGLEAGTGLWLTGNGITPGATLFTEIPIGANAFANARVRWITPALDAQ